MRKTIQAAMIAALAALCAPASFAATVNFEELPGGLPRDRQIITDQFEATAGVTFNIRDFQTGQIRSSGPALAQVGGTGTAFFGEGFDRVQPSLAERVGRFFLTDNNSSITGRPDNFILTAIYSTASAFFSADILDLEGSEAFDVRFYDAAVGGNLLNNISIIGGDPDTGDGAVTQVAYDHGTAEILRVEFVGTSISGVGFDNFTSDFVAGQNLPSPVPLPASAWLLILGLIGAWAVGRRRSGLA